VKTRCHILVVLRFLLRSLMSRNHSHTAVRCFARCRSLTITSCSSLLLLTYLLPMYLHCWKSSERLTVVGNMTKCFVNNTFLQLQPCSDCVLRYYEIYDQAFFSFMAHLFVPLFAFSVQTGWRFCTVLPVWVHKRCVADLYYDSISFLQMSLPLSIELACSRSYYVAIYG